MTCWVGYVRLSLLIFLGRVLWRWGVFLSWWCWTRHFDCSIDFLLFLQRWSSWCWLLRASRKRLPCLCPAWPFLSFKLIILIWKINVLRWTQSQLVSSWAASTKSREKRRPLRVGGWFLVWFIQIVIFQLLIEYSIIVYLVWLYNELKLASNSIIIILE